MVDRERERIIRHLESRGVDIGKLLYLQPNASKKELKDLLSGLMQFKDTTGQ